MQSYLPVERSAGHGDIMYYKKGTIIIIYQCHVDAIDNVQHKFLAYVWYKLHRMCLNRSFHHFMRLTYLKVMLDILSLTIGVKLSFCSCYWFI